MELKVDSPNVNYTPEYIESKYEYQYTRAEKNGKEILVSRVTNIKKNYINNYYFWRQEMLVKN